MGRKGQCPACFKVHSIDKAQLGSAIQCTCGETLFVCDAHSFAEIPIRCPACKESYSAETEDIGQILECDCGAEIEVFSTVLQRPIQRDAEAAEAAVEAANVVPDDSVLPVVSTDARRTTRSSEPEAKRPDRSSLPWLPIGGGIAVALFFVVAVVMFLMRDSGIADADADGDSADVIASETSNDSPASRASPLAIIVAGKVEPGAIGSLLAKVPAPAKAQQVPVSDAVSIESDVADDEPGSETRSPFGGPTVARKKTLPPPTEARLEVPIVEVERPYRIFDHAYQQAFESYEAFTAVEDADSEEYRVKLGETIYLMRHAYQLALETDDKDRLGELSYLMAYLLHKAGYVIEASIYGEAAARWGEADDSSTRESLMIALAATQEAASIQWGEAQQVGELGQMQTLAELLDQRWPDDPQRDEIWLNLAQNYAAFNQPLLAANAYLRIKKNSDRYAAAQLAAGGEFWNHFIDQASVESPDPQQMVELLESASERLATGVKLLESEATKPTMQLVSAKLTLAKIADRLGNTDAVLKWLEEEPMPLTEVVTATDTSEAEKLKVDASLARNLHVLLFHAKNDRRDFDGARRALKQLSRVMGADQSEELGRMYLIVVKEQIESVTRKSAVSAADVETLAALLNSLEASGWKLDASVRLWIGESWAKIADNSGDAGQARSCYARAAEAYAVAMNQDDFAEQSLAAAMLRRSELLRLAGQLRESLEMISGILDTSPNAIALQFQAALSLQQVAFDEGTIVGLVAAIHGPVDAQGQPMDSPVWGWEKLVTFLHKLRFSPTGTTQHARQLMEAQYHLARCRWILAEVMDDSEAREELLVKTRTQLQRLLATTSTEDPSSVPWRKGFETILAQMNGAQMNGENR